jgi:hypothetical protein
LEEERLLGRLQQPGRRFIQHIILQLHAFHAAPGRLQDRETTATTVYQRVDIVMCRATATTYLSQRVVNLRF